MGRVPAGRGRYPANNSALIVARRLGWGLVGTCAKWGAGTGRAEPGIDAAVVGAFDMPSKTASAHNEDTCGSGTKTGGGQVEDA